MAAYGLAVQAIYPDRPVRCAIVWTATATVMEIPQSLWQNCSFDPAVA
jgi:ATP-dependent helicase/nuclease subunit A